MRTRIIATLGVMLALPALPTPISAARPRNIDVGGHRLRLTCEGEGRPVVLLEAGAGDGLEVWSAVQGRVRRFTRVCSYDRAGIGASDPGPYPRSIGRTNAELYALLQGAGIEGPLIMVGHSIGGLMARLFAARHPERVAALVLVDSTHEDYPSRIRPWLNEHEIDQRESSLAGMSPAARSELRAADLSVEEFRQAGPGPPRMTIVITAGARRERRLLNRLWMRLQQDLASAPGVVAHVVADDSGHSVHVERPEVVARAVRELVDAIRATH